MGDEAPAGVREKLFDIVAALDVNGDGELSLDEVQVKASRGGDLLTLSLRCR
jgi:hypothetical protein